MWPMATADGSKVFFMSDRSGAQNIWVLPRGGQAKQLTKFTDGRVLWPTLSYDGNEITFERNFHIWKMNADSGKAQELSITLRGAASTPMTDRVALAGQIRDLALSPDGKKVAVIARGEVFAASASDGGDAVRVTNTPAAESFVTWSTDSRKLIYASERNGSSELYQYDFTTETETPITQGKNIDASPVFSPDGKSLAFIRNSRTVMVYDMQSKTEREVDKDLHRSRTAARRRQSSLVARRQVDRVSDQFARDAIVYECFGRSRQPAERHGRSAFWQMLMPARSNGARMARTFCFRRASEPRTARSRGST